MAAEKTSKLSEAYPLKAGDGPNSYAKNSAYQGVVREEKVDSFNIPIYTTSPQELQAAVEKNGCFSAEKMENLPRISALDIENVTRRAQLIAYHVRAATEGLIKQQLGDEILDELLGLYSKKLEQQPSISESGKRGVVDAAKELLSKAIAEKLDIDILLSSNSFQIADLGSALMDLARKGGVSEEKVDSFNIPIYCMSPQELEAAVERNGSFSIESMENLPHVSVDDTVSKSQLLAAHMRAGMEGLVKQKFGEEILDELFDLFRKKLEKAPFFFETGKTTNFLCVLRRKGNGFEHAV
ncbi:hypothetical protein GBA52_017902 [Prunus armeniaca]|nr:hypothetical protein GBA52_017902 [Prunus armeniaca]